MQFFIDKITFPAAISKLFAEGNAVAKVKKRTGDVEVSWSIGLQEGEFIKMDLDEITGTFTISEEKYLENSTPDQLIQLIKDHFHEANKF